MERRTATVLSLAVLLVAVPLGGCLGLGGAGGPGATPTDDPTTPPTEDPTTTPPTDEPATTPPTTDPTTSPTTPPPGGYLSIAVEAERVLAADLVDAFSRTPGEFGPERRPTVRRLLNRSNHTVTTLHLGHPGHVDDGELLAGDGAYYRVDRTVLDRWNTTAFEFELSNVRDPNASVREAALAAGNLSAVDRSVLRDGLPTGERRGVEGSFTAEFRHAFADGTVPDAATLADGDVHYVRLDGRYYRIRRTGSQRVTRYRVEYAAGFVTESRSDLAETLVDQYVTDVSALPNGSGQRALVVEALEGQQVRWETDDGADPPADVAALRDLFDEYETGTGGVYVRYDGDLYRLDLRVAVS